MCVKLRPRQWLCFCTATQAVTVFLHCDPGGDCVFLYCDPGGDCVFLYCDPGGDCLFLHCDPGGDCVFALRPRWWLPVFALWPRWWLPVFTLWPGGDGLFLHCDQVVTACFYTVTSWWLPVFTLWPAGDCLFLHGDPGGDCLFLHGDPGGDCLFLHCDQVVTACFCTVTRWWSCGTLRQVLPSLSTVMLTTRPPSPAWPLTTRRGDSSPGEGTAFSKSGITTTATACECWRKVSWGRF